MDAAESCNERALVFSAAIFKVSQYCPEFSERTGECPDGVDEHAGSKGRSNLCAGLKSMLGPTFFTASTTNFAISSPPIASKNSTFDHPLPSISPSRLHCDALQHDQQNSTSAEPRPAGPRWWDVARLAGYPCTKAGATGKLRVIPQRSAAGPARRAPHAVSTATSADPAAAALSRRQSR